jgi:radical SAM protein with 4Fe4S-binding SPASM domain
MNDEIKVKVNPTFHEHSTGKGSWEKENDVKYIEYRDKWFNNPGKFLIERAPLNLDIEISSACNLRCPMCDRTIEMAKGEKKAYHSGLMDFDLYKKLIDEATEIGVYAVKLNWRGEPLMHPRVIEMVRYAKEKGIIDIMFNTNGVLLTEKMSKDLIDAGIDKIFVSIDSIHKDRFEKYRTGANYEEVMDNLLKLKEINDSTGHKVETRVSKVLLKETEDENEEYSKFFEKLVDKVAYLDYIPYGEKDYGRPVDRTYKDFKFACSQLWLRLFVSWDGKYAMCCVDTKEVNILGDAHTQTVEEVWHSKKLQEIRDKHKEGKWYEVEQCRNCYSPYL